jgi:adenylate cyclase
MPKLSVTDPSGNARAFELGDRELVIGRGTNASLILEDRHASRLHARVTKESGSWVVTDLDSANGLFVNDERVGQKVLIHQDVIRVGRSRLLFEDEGAPPDVRFSDSDPSGGAMLVRRVEEAAAPGAAATEEELETLRKKARILTLMYELGHTLKGAISLEEIYRQVSRLLLEVCAADRVLILQREGEGEGLRLAHRADKADGAAPASRNRTVSRTVTGKVLAERVTLLSSNASVDPALALVESVVLQQIRSVICAPLLVRGEARGVIYLDQENVAAFTNEDLDVVNAVAAQAAIALENVDALGRLTREAAARAAYSRFLPAHVVEDLLQRPESLRPGGVNQIATVLFADIRGFTRLSARLEPEQVVALLNEYFGEMTEVIFEHGGTLDKYIGDGLMALFGAPYAGPDDALRAVRAAVAMQKRLELMKEEFGSKDSTWSGLSIGIGVNTGLVTVGYVGSEKRLDYTAIGDTVNMAARLESSAPAEGVYISRSTHELLEGQFDCRPLSIHVKGKDEPVDCYQVVWE